VDFALRELYYDHGGHGGCAQFFGVFDAVRQKLQSQW
jgi:hypothetical protein